MLQRFSLLLDSIKFAHSIFALPFALLAMIVAAGGWPSWRIVLPIVVCMVAARSAAMAFNRYLDREFDAENPRTKTRPTVTGEVSPVALRAFMAGSIVIFFAATWAINEICFVFAFPVLAILLGYSFAKQFTALCHFWLGFALGMAPVAAHLAVRGNILPMDGLGARWGLAFEAFPILLGVTVLFWVSGFDLIYACQDYEFDKNDTRLHSMPKKIGIKKSLLLSSVLHALAGTLLIGLGIYAAMGLWYFAAVAGVCGLLVYEHWIVKADDLSRVNMAFFTLNGVVSLLLFAAVFIERVVLAR